MGISDLKKDERLADSKSYSRGLTIGLTIVLLFVFSSVLKHGLYTIFEVTYGAEFVRSRMIGMCGTAWWGGQHLVNFFFKPTYECDGYDWTFHIVGAVFFLSFFPAYLISKSFARAVYKDLATAYFSWFNKPLIIPVIIGYVILIYLFALRFHDEKFGGNNSLFPIILLNFVSISILYFSKKRTNKMAESKNTNTNSTDNNSPQNTEL